MFYIRKIDKPKDAVRIKSPADIPPELAGNFEITDEGIYALSTEGRQGPVAFGTVFGIDREAPTKTGLGVWPLGEDSYYEKDGVFYPTPQIIKAYELDETTYDIFKDSLPIHDNHDGTYSLEKDKGVQTSAKDNNGNPIPAYLLIRPNSTYDILSDETTSIKDYIVCDENGMGYIPLPEFIERQKMMQEADIGVINHHEQMQKTDAYVLNDHGHCQIYINKFDDPTEWKNLTKEKLIEQMHELKIPDRWADGLLEQIKQQADEFDTISRLSDNKDGIVVVNISGGAAVSAPNNPEILENLKKSFAGCIHDGVWMTHSIQGKEAKEYINNSLRAKEHKYPFSVNKALTEATEKALRQIPEKSTKDAISYDGLIK